LEKPARGWQDTPVTIQIPRSGPAGLVAVALVMLGACAPTVVTTPSSTISVGSEQVGLASWYGHPYHGRRTTSGEVYDMRDLTAAHRALPFGTRLMVTNLDNGRIVEVRVNDRGPFVEERILDLSHAAATLLGGEGVGTIRVRLRVTALPDASPVRAPATGGSAFSVQLGAFVSRARADSLREAAERDGSAATVSETVVGGQTFYRVRIGPYPDRLAAEAGAKRLATRGYFSVVVSER
jgi:peptidoglycan lytic transglycosylase